MIQERLWLMLGIMMVLPIIIIMLVPEPYATIGALGCNLVMLFYIRRFYKGMASKMLGSKMKFVCSVCQGTKFEADGTCKRCGSKNRKLD